MIPLYFTALYLIARAFPLKDSNKLDFHICLYKFIYIFDFTIISIYTIVISIFKMIEGKGIGFWTGNVNINWQQNVKICNKNNHEQPSNIIYLTWIEFVQQPVDLPISFFYLCKYVCASKTRCCFCTFYFNKNRLLETVSNIFLPRDIGLEEVEEEEEKVTIFLFTRF